MWNGISYTNMTDNNIVSYSSFFMCRLYDVSITTVTMVTDAHMNICIIQNYNTSIAFTSRPYLLRLEHPDKPFCFSKHI